MNKRIYLVGPSALTYLRLYSAYARREYRLDPIAKRSIAELSRPQASRFKTLVRPCSSAIEIRRAGLCEAEEPVAWDDVSDLAPGFCPLPLPQPLHVLVPNHSENRQAEGLIKHVWTGDLPAGSFWKAGTADAQFFQDASEPYDVYVASPELVFVQMASIFSKQIAQTEPGSSSRRFAHLEAVVQTLLVGMELCGTYAMPDNWAGAAIYQRRPLTSVAKISTLFNKLPNSQRSKIAKEALGYLIDASASPMETAMYLMGCLPRRYGGYALPVPTANHPIEVNDRFKELAHRDYYVPDLFYVEQRLDIEYDSNEFHDTHDSITDRAKRDNALHAMGVGVLSVTWPIIIRAESFEKVVHAAYRALDMQWRTPSPTECSYRTVLRALVLPPSRYW